MLKCFELKKKEKEKKKEGFGFWVGYGYPWIIYSGKIRVWILTGIDNQVSMGKLFGSGIGIPDPYPTHDHPYSQSKHLSFWITRLGWVAYTRSNIGTQLHNPVYI